MLGPRTSAIPDHKLQTGGTANLLLADTGGVQIGRAHYAYTVEWFGVVEIGRPVFATVAVNAARWQMIAMKHALLRRLVLAPILLTFACSSPLLNDGNQQALADEEVAKIEKYEPFPGALSARLFVQAEPFSDIMVDKLVDRRGRVLTPDELKQLKAVFQKKTIIRIPAKGYVAASCMFSPRHVFRFYNNQNAPLGEVLVCFECYDIRLRPSGLLATKPFPEKGDTILIADFSALKKLMRQMSVPTYEVP
jgi:hypothetical protein